MGWFSDTLDRTEASPTIVDVGLFTLGLGVHDKGTARDDCLMQWTTGMSSARKDLSRVTVSPSRGRKARSEHVSEGF